MKKYYVKVLPKEGKVEYPNYVFFKINGKWTEACEFDSFIGPQIEEVKGGVPYLVSRDIKVGDIATEMLDDGSYEDFEIHTENDIFPDMIERNLQFKVVKRLSPDAATWAKDGDEFDDYQEYWFEFVKDTTHPLEHRPVWMFRSGNELDKQLEAIPERFFIAARVKCKTCNRFH